ncbi:MAG: CoB--CoM heterodisulfide reductase iron-sulfur subunit B family protein [candidate division NC10 bacterium]|nr:CoB--CoM heterodisulfide reductase iron-sulfur subunit B family protein [candidate division NC10 bacterium]
MTYRYFPGCSLKSSGRAYEESLLAVFHAIGVPLQELDDWNCCGATSYMSVDEVEAFALAARNLALAEQAAPAEGGGTDVVAPCNACYLVLLKTQRYMAEHPDLAQKVRAGLQAVGLTYEGRTRVRHPLDVLVNDIGLDQIKKRVTQKLSGLKVACYYGCQIVRPFAAFDSAYNPTSMDRLVTALGATPVTWPLKTRCCGGTLTGTIPDAGLRLNRILLKEAKRRGADVMVTVCPLCQFNLECYQGEIRRQLHEDVRLPVMYLTQLVGQAFGLSDTELGLQRLFVPPARVPAAQEGGKAAHA